MMELQTTMSPGGMSPKAPRILPAKSEEEPPLQKICGCIPQSITGDFGCICKPLSCIKYWINPTVMGAAIVIIWSFVIWCAVDTDRASTVMDEAQTFVVRYFGWFYISSLIVFGSFSIYFMCSSFGDIKLGPPDEPPKYGLMTWFSMLFSAGIGVGLYYFGVAEPVWHFDDMQTGSSRWYHLTANQQAMEALNISWFHWGFTASATYCAAALPLAYHHHVKNEPLRESVCFMALIGEKYANGLIGCLIDLTSVIGTMFGVATSLGFGVLSINAGLKFLFDVEESLSVQLTIIWVITAFATVSVLTGLDYGIRRLSEINFSFSFIVLFFMFFVVDPFYLLNLFIQGIGYHFQWILELTFNTQAFEQAGFYDTEESNEKQVTWMSAWTVFYWAWWIAWAPFVGIFIAQISRGRTIREFIIGNMMVPTLLTCVWLTVFGGIGLYNELGSIQNGVECGEGADNEENWYSEYDGRTIVKLSCYGAAQDMLFATFSTLPLGKPIGVISMIAILMYFVTSSDSASHVIDILTAGGNVEPPKLQRIFWALSEGAVAAVLLATGSKGVTGSDNWGALKALQTASLVAALPFCVVLLFEVMATYKTLCIHMGYIDPSKMIYWRYDLFECGNIWPNVIIGLICPPYYQMKTRLKLCEHNQKVKDYQNSDNANGSPNNNGALKYQKDNKEENEHEHDHRFMFDKHFEDNHWKYLWICGLWISWFLTILFVLLEFAKTGFFELGLSFYLFYVILCCINRGNIKGYYKIDSSHIIFDMCSWVFCWCCASVQEDLQSDQDMDFSTQLIVKKSIENVIMEDESDENDENEHENQNENAAERSSFLQTTAVRG